jgi:small subunit ribosomal protein S16
MKAWNFFKFMPLQFRSKHYLCTSFLRTGSERKLEKQKMAVKIRLARRGRKKLALFDIVVADARAPRDGRFIEKIGVYNPNTNPATIEMAEDKAFEWVMNGAQPTDTVRAMLSYRGILLKKHLQIGVAKGAITQEQADKKFEEWQGNKNSKITGKVDMLSKKKADDAKARFEAESKIKEARAEAIRKKREVPVVAEAEAPVAEDAATEATETPSAEAAESTEA